MLTELCQEIRNWFERSKYFGTFTIRGGELNVSDLTTDGSLQDGQYFRIIGSVFNDGVHQHPATDLTDEVFEGAIWAMAVPPSVVDLSKAIDDWKEKYGSAIASPYQSESFGGYSYSMKSAGAGSNGNSGVTWKSTFANELDKWRKI